MQIPIVHLVLFRFKPLISPEQITSACHGLLDLKTKCFHPTTREPYILSIKGGKDTSPEELQGGITYTFVVEFACESDRDYYVKHDPVHLSFVKMVGNIVEKAQVIDFVPGKF